MLSQFSSHALPALPEIQRYLLSFEVADLYRAERDLYVNSNLIRFRETLAWIPPAPCPDARLLELGASPYLLTLLLKRYTGYRIEVSGEDLPDRDQITEIVKRNQQTGDEYTFQVQNFNVETDQYPYEDHAFDLVLCCELIEHLVLDPTHMLVEIHRVLKPGGRLLITTPNVLVLRHINSLVLKHKNIYGPYSGYGVYGRHNREWTLDELVQLTEGCGFVVERADIRDTYPHKGYTAWLKRFFPHLRDVIFVLARAEGNAVPYYPDNLYVAQYARHLRRDRP